VAVPARLERRSAVIAVALDAIEPNPHQARAEFPVKELDALAETLHRHGLLQPIVVRSIGADRYQLVAGERRFRAARRLGWPTIDALVRPVSDQESAELALVENELRTNVAPLDTARAVTRLIERFGHTHEDVAFLLGLERSSVTNLLRLLKLDPQVQPLVGDGDGKLSAGHAKALLRVTRVQQRALARRVIRDQLSVRQLEALIKRHAREQALAFAPPSKDPNLARLEVQLSEYLGHPAALAWDRTGGRLTLSFWSMEELDGFFERVGFKPQ
jgi:ParB family chromosome partitioning protein